MSGKVIAANIHLIAGGTDIKGNTNFIALKAMSGNSMNLVSGVLNSSGNTISLPATVGIDGALQVTQDATVSGSIVATGNSSFASGANLTVTGNVYTSGAVNSANLQVNSRSYIKTGAWERISVNTAVNAANITFKNIPSRFNRIRLTFVNLQPNSNNSFAIMKLSTDNGVTANSTGYDGYNWRHAITLTAAGANVRPWESASIPLNGPFDDRMSFQWNVEAKLGVTGELFMDDFCQAKKTKIFGIMNMSTINTIYANFTTQGYWNYNVVNDAIDIYYDTGVFSGTIYLDGLQA